jgi:hypothetical protein
MYNSSENKFAEYWIDVHKDSKDEFIQHLTSHCIRKKVQIQDLSSLMSVYCATVNNILIIEFISRSRTFDSSGRTNMERTPRHG